MSQKKDQFDDLLKMRFNAAESASLSIINILDHLPEVEATGKRGKKK